MSTWRSCSTCRTSIDFEEIYWECSVSTCARIARTGLFFCSVSCWEAHLPTMRHREAWAVEKRAPTESAWRRAEAEAKAEAEPARHFERAERRPERIERRPERTESSERSEIRRQVVSPGVTGSGEDLSDDVLVVVSKLKKYVKATSGMNTSDGVVPVLSAHLRRICDLAIRKAAEEGRKTVLDRDFKAIF
jgi:hypothetical protein